MSNIYVKIFTKLAAAIIVLLACSGFAKGFDLSDIDPCESRRKAWQADNENAVLLERWNKCLEKMEAAKVKAIAAEQAEATARAKRPGAKVGMSTKQVINGTNWGHPNAVNRTITAGGVQEQWVYDGGYYLYFVNGKLIAIQTSD